MISEKKAKEEALAAEVVRLAQNTLLVRYRFLDRALFRMQPRVHESVCGTDGRFWQYVPARLLARYVDDRDAAVHLLLHSLLHNVFRHFFANAAKPELWDIACDMMAEKIVSDLQVCSVSADRAAVLGIWQKEIVPFTAEKIYAYLVRENLNAERLAALAELFCEDDHVLWYGRQSVFRKDKKEEMRGARTGRGNTPQGATQEEKREQADQALTKEPGELPQGTLQAVQADERDGNAGELVRLVQGWQEIAQRMQVELEHFARGGQGSSDLSMQLAFANRRLLNRWNTGRAKSSALSPSSSIRRGRSIAAF